MKSGISYLLLPAEELDSAPQGTTVRSGSSTLVLRLGHLSKEDFQARCVREGLFRYVEFMKPVLARVSMQTVLYIIPK